MNRKSPNLRPDHDPDFDTPLQLASRFMALLKSGRSYSVEHIGFTQQLENYLTLLEPLLRERGALRFDAPDGDLCLNGERLPFRQHTERALEHLAQEFGARTVSGVEFTPGLTLPEFQTFMRYFLLGERWKGEELITACTDAGVVHVQALPLRAVAVDRGASAAVHSVPEALGAAREAWAAVFAGTQQLLTGDALDHGIELRHVKRIVHPLVESVLARDRITAALASVAPGETVWAHAAHTALTAVSVGARLGLGRPDLADIAVAALLHDVGHAWAGSGTSHASEGVRRIAWATTLNRNSLDAMRVSLEHHEALMAEGAASSSLLSMLVAMSDAYVTLLSRGESRAEWMSPSSALARVLELVRAGGQPALGVALVRALGFYPPGQLVELDDGSIARTLVAADDDPERPWVQLVVDARGTRISSGHHEAMPLPAERHVARALPRDQWPVDDATRPAA